jgi:hypothetical protein
MADGTPLEALETGADIPNTADAQKMAEIMREMNASAPMAPEPMPAARQAPPMYPQHPSYAQQPPGPPANYVAMEDEYRPRKGNVWRSITSKLRDPLFVSLLVFVLSLPILHTHLAKYAGWAFAVGGQLSWFGLLALSLLAGVLFAGFQGVSALIGF